MDVVGYEWNHQPTLASNMLDHQSHNMTGEEEEQEQKEQEKDKEEGETEMTLTMS